MNNRCLYCHQPLAVGEVDYHSRCCHKFFGTAKPPVMPYRTDELSALAQLVVRAQTTVTGVQPKLSLDLEQMSPGIKRFTIVGLWGRYILKPPTEAYPCLPELEDVTMHMAQLARIETVPHALIRFADGALGYITRRIDRDKDGHKIPMEDMCQLTERLTEDKYKSSHERIAKAIERYSSVPKLDLVKYWQQVVFSWIVGNADMHLKNYSLYAPDDEDYVLTPAYDLLSTALVLPQDPEELALTVSGKKRKLRHEDFVAAMTQSGLNEKVCQNIFKRFVNTRDAWHHCIRQSFLPDDKQEQFIALIDTRLQSIG
ncbi:MAG: HipA domain-containing protein [Muribaculaceae bacterium]|nr:HipA domain-containing protein [Muribaculaceae bacterium]